MRLFRPMWDGRRCRASRAGVGGSVGRAKAAAKPKAPGTKKRRGVKLEPTELQASEIVVAEHEVAYQILALNIEKAYNLREKAIEVVRLYRELARLGGEQEEAYALEFEEPALITLGFGYEKRPRLSGGAYFPVLRKVDGW